MASTRLISDDAPRADRLGAVLRDMGRRTREPASDQLLAAVESRLFSSAREHPAALGRYRILDRLGEGGMGVVYRAHDPELSRDVAIKLLRRRSSGRESARERLRQEARALADVSHPNVVQVYDVGTDGDAIYISMELVPGIDLQRWLEHERRPWREVLRMFIAAGHGLRAAHERGLVHRDFKPSNVLVGPDGRARVVDFGLAVVSEPPSTVTAEGSTTTGLRAGALTESGVALGTPVYMAPEQHAGKIADARSDQYSFCLSLYEGLFARRPFQGATLQELVTAKERTIPVPAAGHGIPSGVLRAVLRGMRPDRERRFPSMAVLLATLERAARPTRRGTWAAGLVVVIAGGSVAAWATQGDRSQPARCPPGPERLHGVWDETRATTLHATFERSPLPYAAQTWPRVRDRLDAYASQWAEAYDQTCRALGEPGIDVTPLDRRMACLDDRRESLASLVEVLAAGEGQAIQNAIAAASGLRSVSGCDDPAGPEPLPEAHRAQAEQLRRDLLKAESLGKVARFDDALALAEPALARARELDLPALQAEALLTSGRLHKGQGHSEQAQARLSEAALLARSLGRDEIAARASITLVDVLGAWQSRYDEALEWDRHARAAIERLGGDVDLEAERLSALGSLELTLGHMEPSLAAFEASLALVRRAYGDGHPRLARAQSDLGDALVRAGRFHDGLVAGRQALALGEQAFGPGHPQVGIMHSRLSNAWVREGDYDQAVEHAQRAIDTLSAALGPEHPNVVAMTVNLAQVEQRRGHLDEAAATYERALPLVAGMPNEAIVLASMSELARDRGDFPAALRHAQRSRECREALYGAEDTRVAIGLIIEGEALARLGRDDEAFAAFAAARRIAEHKPLPAPARVLLHAYEGRAHVFAGRMSEAIPMLRATLQEQEQLDAESIDRADVRFFLVQALWATGERDEARQQLRRVDEELAPLGARAEHRRAPIEAWMEREHVR